MGVGLIGDLVLQYLEQQEVRKLPLKLRIYSALREAILSNRLAPGTQLPATRALSEELNAGRNTVVRAYERLLAEGYVLGQVGAGTFVADTLSELTPRMARPARAATPSDAELLSARGSVIAGHAAASKIQHGAFMPGIPDVELFPHALWRRLLGRYLRREHSRLLQYAAGGYGPLKASIAEYLRASRFIRCDPKQIVIIDGTHQALDLCARMLADPGDTAWMEDPGYWGARNVLRAAGLTLKPIPVDEQGIAPRAEDWREPPRLIFVSPSCQYPTGAVLSLARRRALLEYSAACGAWIIEDDYDNELRYHKNPVASLCGLANAERVIYIGTFSKVMFPGLRLAYMVVPPGLVDALASGNSELYREGRLVEQAALADFIVEGHLASHIRKMRKVYAERQAVLRESLEGMFGSRLTLSGGHAGIHLLYFFNDATDDEALAREALNAGVLIRPLSLYYEDKTQRRPGMMLGYAGVSCEQIGPAAQRLGRVIDARISAGRGYRLLS